MRWNRQPEFSPGVMLLGSLLVISWIAPATTSMPAEVSPWQTTPGQSPAPIPASGDLAKRNLPEFFVMIDPSHGGDDKGAVLAGNLLEKDVTLSWARDLKRHLEERGIPARLLRDSDQTIGLERRAELTNEARPSVYVALHAGPLGYGVRVYRPAIPFAQQPGAGRFASWESAQNAWLDRSRLVARAVTVEIRKQGRQARDWATSLRPLNNLVTPAIAVELTPSSNSSENQKLENSVASAIASGIAQARSQLGAHP